MATRPDDDPEDRVIRSNLPFEEIEIGHDGVFTIAPGESFLPNTIGPLTGFRGISVPKCVLEWSEAGWGVVEIIGASDGYDTSPDLDGMEPGSYPGQRILTPLQPATP